MEKRDGSGAACRWLVSTGRAAWRAAPLFLLAACAACRGTGGPASEPPAPPADALAEPLLAERVQAATRTVRDTPDSAAAWGRLGEVYDANGYASPALACYARAAELDPRDWRWPYFAGLLLQPTDPAAALARLSRAAELQPAHAALEFHLGSALYRAERFDEAERRFSRAIELDPACLNARLGLADVADSRGDPAAALAELERAVQVAPEVAAVHLRLAQVYHELQRPVDAAREERLTATSTLPALPDALIALDDPVREELRKRERIGAVPLLLEARRLMLEGRDEQASVTLERVLEADPQSAVALVVSARLLLKRGDASGARARLERARELAPQSTEARVELGGLYALEGEIERAIGVLREALEIDPHLARVKSNLAGLLLRTGRAQEALDLLLEAQRDLPDDAEIRARLALVRRQLGYSGEGPAAGAR